MKLILIISLSILTLESFSQTNSTLQTLGEGFFRWRAVMQPSSGDDIPRVERPEGWVPDFSQSALQEYNRKYQEFRRRLREIPQTGWSRADSVDFLLMRSAIERVNWELNVLRVPYRNPDFYVHQTLGILYELLLIHSPMTERRLRDFILRLQSIPRTLQHARENLIDPLLPFAEIALGNLRDVDSKLRRVIGVLKEVIPEKFFPELEQAAEQAIQALQQYRDWILVNKSSMSENFHIGREAYEYFLKYIALIPYTPEELLQQGRLAWNRAVAFETYETLRNAGIPQPELFESADRQIAQSRQDEQAIRQFLEEMQILTVPDWLKHYTNERIPEYIRPLTHLGVVDDLTSESRLTENSVRYIPEPSPELSFFSRASAQDPRPIIIHEGIPGHYYQMVRSWKNPDLIRRYFFDSGPNEGIAFYVEELLLQFGLFDDRPHSREIIYRFMRLRALRVEIDIRLALGDFTIEEAGRYLAATVPMDYPTAVQEAGFFAYNPGQAISYQIGKQQIFKFLTDARIRFGENFNLRDFHDYLMENGNLPIALLRWEYLGLHDEIDRLW